MEFRSERKTGAHRTSRNERETRTFRGEAFPRRVTAISPRGTAIFRSLVCCRGGTSAGQGSTEARVQYAYIEEPKTAQIILSHPKTPIS